MEETAHKKTARLGYVPHAVFKAAIGPKGAINSEEIPIHLVMMIVRQPDAQSPAVPTPFTPPGSKRQVGQTLVGGCKKKETGC